MPFTLLRSHMVALGLYCMGIPAVQAMRKIHFGFFGAQSPEEILANARDGYEAYYRDVRAAVPPGQMLEYRMGDGWAPLCEVLKVDVPDVPFPRENEASSHAEESRARVRLLLTPSVNVVAPVLLGLAAMWAAFAFSQTA